jgi:hypothetical protein
VFQHYCIFDQIFKGGIVFENNSHAEGITFSSMVLCNGRAFDGLTGSIMRMTVFLLTKEIRFLKANLGFVNVALNRDYRILSRIVHI